VLFGSTHAAPLYPGTGNEREMGREAGYGATLNIPLPYRTGDIGFAQVFDQLIAPAIRRFGPELILVSAGYDAHWDDPLGPLTLSISGFGATVRGLAGLAGELCGGRLALILEEWRLRRPEANASTYRDNLATLTLGSAAVAMILRRADDSRTGHRLRGGVFQAATEHNRLCLGTETGMVTDPPKLLAEGVALARRTWEQSRVELGWDHPQIAEYALHQVGKANHEALIKNLSLPDAKALRVYTGLGNVGAAGVPITLALAVEQGRLRTGQTAALMGIGSGLNVAMMRVDW